MLDILCNYKMKMWLVLTLLSISGSCSADWKHLHLKYDALLNGYFPIPLTLGELTLKGDWELMTTDKDLNVGFYSYGKDPRVSIGFDSHGNIAGVRVCYIIKDLTKKADEKGLKFPYTFDDKPMFSKSTFWGHDVYFTTVLFASPETLSAGGRAITNGLLGEDLYVRLNGEYTVMPKLERDAPSLGFTKQKCFVGMGLHYFHNMSPTTDCNDLQGNLFLLYEGGQLIGMGISTFGSHTTAKRDWFESPSSFIAKNFIAPNSPSCLAEWIDNYGLSGLHLFFKQFPRLTFCL